MAFGMVANIVVARFTRLKYIFLTGHHTFYMACMIGVILTVAGFGGRRAGLHRIADPGAGDGLLPGVGPTLYEADYRYR
ncbi:PTS system ascorbate-specific transporter subunit IIC [Salmonella enterica subsp. enterica]|nr:PTS system ascorbate-specific transporter subunit IIC [Salmonella enterica subsp. enterica]